MATLEQELVQQDKNAEGSGAEPAQWTVEQFGRMSAMGWFVANPAELLQGEIYDKLPDTLNGKPRRFLWTKPQYHKMATLGWFRNARVELVNGEIYTMPATSAGHWKATGLVGQALRSTFGPNNFVMEQAAFDGGPRSEPLPDCAVYKGSVRDYDVLPSHALLIVEVSKSTLVYDQMLKAALYASCGIEDYWIVNLRRRALEVRRQPKMQPNGEYGYDDLTVYGSSDTVSPLAAPDATIAVSDLLP